MVGEASDGLEAIALCRRTAPDVVLMDVRMPHLDGLSATRTILADPACADTRVVVLTTFDEDELVLEALRSGASGFLLKDTRPDQLLEAIKVVAAGEALLHPRVTRRLIERFAELPQPRRPPDDDGLTDRERDVLLAVAQGLSNQEIAAQLHLGYGTVKTHVSHLLTKLGLPRPGPAGDVRLRVRARGPGRELGCSYDVAAFSCGQRTHRPKSEPARFRRDPMAQLAPTEVDVVIERALAELPFDDWQVIDTRREAKGPRVDFVVVGPPGVFVIGCGRRHEKERAHAKELMTLLDAAHQVAEVAGVRRDEVHPVLCLTGE